MPMSGLEKLNLLVGQKETLELEKNDSDGNRICVSFKMNLASSTEKVEDIEKLIGREFPTDYRRFLNKYNGARLYDYDGIDGFVILGCEEIVKANNFAKATFEEDWPSHLLVFAKYIGESNYLAFNMLQENSVVDCYFEEIPRNWSVIANSFDDFLDRLIGSEGNKYWLK